MAKSKWDMVKNKLNLIEAWCRDGNTEKTICEKLGISEQTLNEYKKVHSELVESLKRGKEVIDVQVENALLKRALGYEYDEITQEPLYNNEGFKIIKDGKPVINVTKIVRKQVVPDTTAQIFWLKNRKIKEWRDKQDIEHSGKMTLDINDMSKLSDEELRRLANGEFEGKS